MLEVNFQRLKSDIQSLSRIGQKADHGIYRMAFSQGDLEGRAWLKERIEAAHLDYYLDGAANLHARLQWDDKIPSVMTGSHIDTVPGAGHLDGALGVIAGLEALRVLKEQNIKLQRPLELVSFSDEEGYFGGMLGSQAMSGQLSPADIYQAKNNHGELLTDKMAELGLDAVNILNAERKKGSIYSFIELHIEQGPVLDHSESSIGIVEAITGLFRWQCSFIGTPNHSGTTPMSMRQDAFQGLTEFSSSLNRILEEHGGAHSVATIGRVELYPGAPNVVPGQADFTLEIRDTDDAILEQLREALRRTASSIARRRHLMFEFNETSTIRPVTSNPAIVRSIQDNAEALAYKYQAMHSGAAHDTQMIAAIAPAAMIFIPSKDGRSHSPHEWTAWEDIERGANTLLNTLYQLAS